MNKNAQRVYDRLQKLSYPSGTDKKKYLFKGGKPTDYFKSELNRLFPKHKNWGNGARQGASCDVSVAVTVKPVLKGYPRGFDEQSHYKGKNCEVHSCTNTSPYKLIKKYYDPNDCVAVIQYWRSGGHHTMIWACGQLHEGSLKKTYLHRIGAGKAKTKRKKVRILIIK